MSSSHSRGESMLPVPWDSNMPVMNLGSSTHQLNLDGLIGELVHRYSKSGDVGVIRSWFRRKKIEANNNALRALGEHVQILRQQSGDVLEFKAHLLSQTEVLQALVIGYIVDARGTVEVKRAEYEVTLSRLREEKIRDQLATTNQRILTEREEIINRGLVQDNKEKKLRVAITKEFWWGLRRNKMNLEKLMAYALYFDRPGYIDEFAKITLYEADKDKVYAEIENSSILAAAEAENIRSHADKLYEDSRKEWHLSQAEAEKVRAEAIRYRAEAESIKKDAFSRYEEVKVKSKIAQGQYRQLVAEADRIYTEIKNSTQLNKAQVRTIHEEIWNARRTNQANVRKIIAEARLIMANARLQYGEGDVAKAIAAKLSEVLGTLTLEEITPSQAFALCTLLNPHGPMADIHFQYKQNMLDEQLKRMREETKIIKAQAEEARTKAQYSKWFNKNEMKIPND